MVDDAGNLERRFGVQALGSFVLALGCELLQLRRRIFFGFLGCDWRGGGSCVVELVSIVIGPYTFDCSRFPWARNVRFITLSGQEVFLSMGIV